MVILGCFGFSTALSLKILWIYFILETQVVFFPPRSSWPWKQFLCLALQVLLPSLCFLMLGAQIIPFSVFVFFFFFFCPFPYSSQEVQMIRTLQNKFCLDQMIRQTKLIQSTNYMSNSTYTLQSTLYCIINLFLSSCNHFVHGIIVKFITYIV